MKKLILLFILIAPLALTSCFPLVIGGIGAGVLIAEDRRTTGAIVEDQAIETKTSNRISQKFSDGVHVNVTSYNRMALLTGEVPSEQVKQALEEIARNVENVKGVHNELVISGVTSLASRSNDALLTSKVKARFVDAAKFQANHVKVVTENGAVFLLGIVNRNEAEAAAEIARTTSGVQRVIKIFEYIN